MKRFLPLAAVATSVLLAGEMRAQSGFAAAETKRLQATTTAAAYSSDRVRNSVYAAAAPRFNFGGVNPGASLNTFSRPNKPFSSISRGPTVTPYLALDQPFANTATNYYTLIRPQLEQQRINDQVQRQAQLMQRQMSQFTSRPPYDPTGSETMAPTGHASVYMNHGGYYQMPAPAGRKR
jgi:hypothetical protein